MSRRGRHRWFISASMVAGSFAMALVLAVVPAGGVAHAQEGSQEGSSVDIAIEHVPELQTGPNFVRLVVDVTYADSGQRPATDEEFFVLAYGEFGGEETEAFGCAPRTITDNRAPNGLYDCSVIVDHGGRWAFTVVVNEPTVPGEVPVLVGQEQTTLDIDAPTLQGLDPDDEGPEARPIDIALNVFHTGVGGAWFAVAAALAALALPEGRRILAEPARHYLETHLRTVVSLLWTAGLLTGGSGLYLAMTRTAYEAPWSLADARQVFDLPYGQEYFSALWVKMAIFILIVLASVSLQREAQRRSRLAEEVRGPATSVPDAPSPWDVVDEEPAPSSLEIVDHSGGGTATMTEVVRTRPSVAIGQHRPANVWRHRLAAIGIALGGAVIVVCAGLLLYFHILIEAAIADLG